MILLLSKTKTQKYFFSFLLIQGRKVLKICSRIPLAKKIMQGTDVLHDSLLKSFSKIQGTQAIFQENKIFGLRKQRKLPVCSKSRRAYIWPQRDFPKAKHDSLLYQNRGTPGHYRGAILAVI